MIGAGVRSTNKANKLVNHALHILNVFAQTVFNFPIVDHFGTQPHARQGPFQIVGQSGKKRAFDRFRFAQCIQHGIETLPQNFCFRWARRRYSLRLAGCQLIGCPCQSRKRTGNMPGKSSGDQQQQPHPPQPGENRLAANGGR